MFYFYETYKYQQNYFFDVNKLSTFKIRFPHGLIQQTIVKGELGWATGTWGNPITEIYS